MDPGQEFKIDTANRNRKGPRNMWKGKTCVFDGCDKPVSARGFCKSHYGKAKWASGHRSPSVNPTSRRGAHLKHRYGITLEDYNRMYAEQEGKCAICRMPAEAVTTPEHWASTLCVDHCHGTGKVRGLLCNHCNLTVGNAKTPEILESAAEYLRLHAG